MLEELNSGILQFSQIGKFLTVYPRSPAEATELARELDLVTRNLCGPEIPFDVRYRKNSLVYYRYGAFRRADGDPAVADVIFDALGKPHKDRREFGHAIPRWFANPFKRSPPRPNDLNVGGPLALGYLPFKAIMQRGKGGVYEAVDLSTSPPRLVIIKEGRRNGETAWDGKDGYARIKHESRVLRILGAAGIPVPQIFHEFGQDGNRYLVLEKIVGRPLLQQGVTRPRKVSWRRAQNILSQLSVLLSKLHETGWVWRDCKPSHVFLHDGMMRIIDFEGACRISETEVLPWGSPNYGSPAYRGKLRRRPGIFEDEYALGVIAFQFATGEFPSQDRRARRRLYNRAGAPVFFSNNIERLLRFKRTSSAGTDVARHG
jgi:serine/threonine protein kinase